VPFILLLSRQPSLQPAASPIPSSDESHCSTFHSSTEFSLVTPFFLQWFPAANGHVSVLIPSAHVLSILSSDSELREANLAHLGLST